MLLQLTTNDILEASNLMSDTWNMDEYQGYERNEGYWIQGLLEIVAKQASGDPNYLAIQVKGQDGQMRAFMTCTVYYESYSGKPVMDVRDMIVDYEKGRQQNAEDVITCFTHMTDYCKQNNIIDWRADSIHSAKHAQSYAQFLDKNFNGYIRYGFRGTL